MGGTESEAGLKQYRAPWKGQLVLACGKCQKRMSRKGKSGRPFKLKAELKRALGGAARVRVLRIPCIKLCPRAGIAICTQAQFGRGSAPSSRRQTTSASLPATTSLALLKPSRQHQPESRNLPWHPTILSKSLPKFL